MKHTFRVLVIGDNPSSALRKDEAKREQHAPEILLTHVTGLRSGLERLAQANFDLAVVDQTSSNSHGGTYAALRDQNPELPMALLTGRLDADEALPGSREALGGGASNNYLFDGELARVLHFALERLRLDQADEVTKGSTPTGSPPSPKKGDKSQAATSAGPDLASLQASEVSYRRLFETAQDGILILDAATGRIKDVNPYLIERLNLSRGEIIGQTVAELSPFKDHLANEAMLQQLHEQGYARYDHLPLETADGRRFAVEFVSNEYQAGADTVIQCNVRDITQQKHLEATLRESAEKLERRVAERTAELEEVNRELEAFSYSVSHDLRAPLRHIRGFVELLHKSVAPNLSDKELHYLDTIGHAAERMGGLIDSLLAFSRVGRTHLEKTDVDLDQLVKDTVRGLTVEVQGRNVDWQIGPLPTVWADPALLRLVLVNLLSNALKFTAPRAEARIAIGWRPDETGEPEIFICDNGVGFDPEYAHKLFGVFQRLHSTTEFEGTGIGLANVQRIILRHGGKVSAAGCVDGGATFIFSLPKKPL